MTAKPELIAPAGNWACARAAVANGANAIYFGLEKFNARMRADNFTEEQLPELVAFLHAHRVRALCTLNTLIFTDELPEAERLLIALDADGVDAVIVQDLGVAVLARALGLRLNVHASTQMTITSPEGLAFAEKLGITRAVLARETSLRELAKFGPSTVKLETFVHGALCVAYSGQCLTSEALGQRSANRGECAQACRLPYQLIVDGALKDLGDRRYLLSPQDLAAVQEIPDLIHAGVTAFKIEGRLKTPEYVAATCQVYRKAIDAATLTPDDQYKLEMTFSRGLYSGWLHGVNHQQLVHARFGKKRGAFIGVITEVGYDSIATNARIPLRPGDGLVIENPADTDHEQGGHIWEVRDNRLYFERGRIDFKKLKPGDRLWKTSDPQLEKELRKTFTRDIPLPKTLLDITVTGKADTPLTLEANGVRVHSAMPLQTAFKRPFTTASLRDQLSRLGETPYQLGEIHNRLTGQVILPVSELNRLRRELISAIPPVSSSQLQPSRTSVLSSLLSRSPTTNHQSPSLTVLSRTLDQLRAALDSGIITHYADFEDLRRYTEAVSLVRQYSTAKILLATPRIQKAGEQAFFTLIENAQPDGVLIRNLGALDYFKNSPLQKIGDFSLNIANPLTADLLKRENLDRLTPSYDLNATQLLDLLRATPPAWFEIVIHQHMPLFHMEHCVFAAFLSTGTDHTNCGRPCDTHNVKLRDRLGIEHPLKADVGCRNTLFHARAQTGADYLDKFLTAGVHHFRVELLEETAAQTRDVLTAYRALLTGDPTATRQLTAVRQLGVTAGTLTVLA